MEEAFTLTWEDATSVVQAEEVICDINSSCIPVESSEFTNVCEEVVVQGTPDEQEVQQEVDGVEGDNIVYLTEDNVLVVQQAGKISATIFRDAKIACLPSACLKTTLND